MGFLRRVLDQLREYSSIAGIGEIARRYFAMNAFDGVLTIIGVLMGNYLAGVQAPAVVVSTGLSTCVAMGVSGLWGAYLTETAERKRGLDDLASHTLTDLSDTKIGRAARAAVIIVALVDGLAPFSAALVVLMPFFFARLLGDITTSYYVSLGLAMTALFALGAFLGKVAKSNLIVSGLKMIVAGVVAIVLSYLLDAG
ncbi:MAG TPA: VIT1/CCC1 transporter family protein [Anaerolineae bacterium]|nr:VIT1/CCC1 transporter family protein [Anaerolineae bacterium]